MTLDLERLENLHQSTTPGPWGYEIWESPSCVVTHPTGFICTTQQGNDVENAVWIVAAHEAFPAMLERIALLEKEVVSLTEELDAIENEETRTEEL